MKAEFSVRALLQATLSLLRIAGVRGRKSMEALTKADWNIAKFSWFPADGSTLSVSVLCAVSMFCGKTLEVAFASAFMLLRFSPAPTVAVSQPFALFSRAYCRSVSAFCAFLPRLLSQCLSLLRPLLAGFSKTFYVCLQLRYLTWPINTRIN